MTCFMVSWIFPPVLPILVVRGPPGFCFSGRSPALPPALSWGCASGPFISSWGFFLVLLRPFRLCLACLAAVHLAFCLFTGFLALTQGEASQWELLLVSGLHPLGGAALLLLVSRSRLACGSLSRALVGLLLLSISGDGLMFLAVLSGVSGGDAVFALSFAAAPALGVVYAVAAAASRRAEPGPSC